jgi:hypothetical protein
MLARLMFDGLPYAFFLITPAGLLPLAEYGQRLENLAYKNFAVVSRDFPLTGALVDATS